LIVEQSLIHLHDDGMSIGQAIIESVRTRIRPIFMTTLGGLVGLLPLVLAPGAGSELYRGIGAVLLGGLLVSTVVTLVFVPCLLSLMMEFRTWLLATVIGRQQAVAGVVPEAQLVEEQDTEEMEEEIAVEAKSVRR
jgi:HAE1 family hydrophobic/amphiphilic exporter-1